jgi:hypothetical protein
MKITISALVISVAVLCSSLAYSQDAPESPGIDAAPQVGVGSPGIETASPGAAEPSGDAPTNEDIVKQLGEAKAALDEYRASNEPGAKKLLLFALFAVVANLLINVIKRFSSLTAKGKKVLPWVAMGLGVLAGGLSLLAAGQGWINAIWYGMAPPGAILLHELFKRQKA